MIEAPNPAILDEDSDINRVHGEERRLLLAALGLLNSTEFPDHREPIRRTTVERLQRKLGYRMAPGAPVTARAHRATDMHPGRHPNDAVERRGFCHMLGDDGV